MLVSTYWGVGVVKYVEGVVVIVVVVSFVVTEFAVGVVIGSGSKAIGWRYEDVWYNEVTPVFWLFEL